MMELEMKCYNEELFYSLQKQENKTELAVGKWILLKKKRRCSLIWTDQEGEMGFCLKHGEG